MTGVHRLHWRVLGLTLAIALGLAALVGLLLAVGNSKPPPPTLTSATRNGLLMRAQSGPPLLGGALGGGGSTASGSSVSTGTVGLNPPSGWAVEQRGPTFITLADPRKLGLLVVLSGTVNGSPSQVQFVQSLVNSTIQGTTNAKICGKIAAGRVPNGPEGLVVPLCYTLVPQNGRALDLYTIIIAALSGKVGTVVKLITPAQLPVLRAFAQESDSRCTRRP